MDACGVAEVRYKSQLNSGPDGVSLDAAFSRTKNASTHLTHPQSPSEGGEGNEGEGPADGEE